MTVYSDNAAQFASTAASSVEAQRHVGVHEALEALVDGNQGRALYALTRSVQRQARMAGLGAIIEVSCPCGGRCAGGTRSIH